MLVDGGDCRLGLSARTQIENCDMACLAFGDARNQFLCRPESRARPRDIAFAHQHLGLAGVRQGETGLGGDGAVIGRQRARVEGQRPLAGVDIGVSRRGRRRGQREAETICQH
jgi:hypothetical protein